ncbi:tetratricopeptide repeat protein [Kaarinaea lacus]
MNNKKQSRLLLSIMFCVFFLPEAVAIVPQRIVNEVYPLDDTIASFTKVINSQRLEDSALAELYRERGVHYSNLGHFKESIEDLSNAIKLNNNYVTAYINRANAYAKLEKYNEAYQDFATAQRLSPKNKSIYILRGSLSFLLGRFNDAVADYQYYLRLVPDDMYRMMWLHLSQSYMDNSKPTDLAKYTRGLNLDVWPGALIKLYLGQVGPKDFLEAFKTNIGSMKPEFLCEGFYYLGQYLLLTGDRKLAADSFRQAVKTNARKTVEYQFALAYLARLAQ